MLSTATANLTETNAVLTTSGTLTVSDVDSAATYVAGTTMPRLRQPDHQCSRRLDLYGQHRAQ
ncbi:hypothetical protein LP419_04935 [Massilia sp. H-1]|nr:hypothetical protein LP419_04935 [Massilia sp. H-1]